MLTPPSTTTHLQNNECEAIASQIGELKQLFQDHERIIEEKSTSLGSIIRQIHELEERSDYDIPFDNIRNQLNGLINTFNGKLVSSYSDQRQVEERENTLLDTFESLATTENQHTEEPHEVMSRLQDYLHSNGHHLRGLGHYFNDILESTNDLMTSIPRNKTNTTHVNELISLVDGCLRSFCT